MLNSKEKLEKAALELFLDCGFVCLRTGSQGMAGRTRGLEDGNGLGIHPTNRQEPWEGAGSGNLLQEKTLGAIRPLYTPVHPSSNEASGLGDSLIHQNPWTPILDPWNYCWHSRCHSKMFPLVPRSWGASTRPFPALRPTKGSRSRVVVVAGEPPLSPLQGHQFIPVHPSASQSIPVQGFQ